MNGLDLPGLLGLPAMGPAEGEAAAIASLCLGIAAAISWFVRGQFGARLTALIHGAETAPPGPLTLRATPLLTAACLLVCIGIVRAAWPWPAYAGLVLGIGTALAVAMLVYHLVKGLRLGSGIAWVGGAIALVTVVASSLHGLDSIAAVLGRVGFNAGSMRFSLLSVLTIIAAVLALFALVHIGNRAIRRLTQGAAGLDDTQRLLIQKIGGIALIIAAFFIGIDLVGIDVTAFAVFSGAFGLAVGFGLQKTIGNLIAGIILLMDRSIKPGDVIVVGDSFGWVNKIGVRAVSVITRDGKEHLIPNENLMTQEVENWSYSSKDVRIRVPVGVSYDCDLAQAQALMLEAAKESPRVINRPPPNVWLKAFGDSSVDHELLVWIRDPEEGVGNVRSDLLNRVWLKFKDAGIGIPYPQRDVHIKTGALPVPNATPATAATPVTRSPKRRS